MRQVKSDRSICKCGNIECSQADNVYRDGYVSIEQQYKQFQRAGINRMEWLKKAYPQEQTIKHNEALLQPETREAFYRAEQYARGDELNILDGQLASKQGLHDVSTEYEKVKTNYENSKKDYEDFIKNSKMDKNSKIDNENKKE